MEQRNQGRQVRLAEEMAVMQPLATQAVLFTFLAERYERRSVVITSNLVFSQWDIAEGHARKEIAAKLCISVKTFDTYHAQLMAKLDIHDVAGLVRFAASAGLTPRDE